MDGKKYLRRRPSYNVRPNVQFKNKLNGDTLVGDLINEEEIDGKPFFVVRDKRGVVIKLTREAFYIQK